MMRAEELNDDGVQRLRVAIVASECKAYKWTLRKLHELEKRVDTVHTKREYQEAKMELAEAQHKAEYHEKIIRSQWFSLLMGVDDEDAIKGLRAYVDRQIKLKEEKN